MIVKIPYDNEDGYIEVNSDDTPISLCLTDKDKHNISNMPQNFLHYCSFPDEGFDEKWIDEFMGDNPFTPAITAIQKETEETMVVEVPVVRYLSDFVSRIWIEGHVMRMSNDTGCKVIDVRRDLDVSEEDGTNIFGKKKTIKRNLGYVFTAKIEGTKRQIEDFQTFARGWCLGNRRDI